MNVNKKYTNEELLQFEQNHQYVFSLCDDFKTALLRLSNPLEQNSENEIRALVLPNDSIKALDNLNCKIYYGDVTKKESLSSVFENIDGKEVYVIHCAGVVYIKSKYNPIVYDVNILLELLDRMTMEIAT